MMQTAIEIKGQFLARAEKSVKIGQTLCVVRRGIVVDTLKVEKWFISDDRLLDLIKFISTLTQQVNRCLANIFNVSVSLFLTHTHTHNHSSLVEWLLLQLVGVTRSSIIRVIVFSVNISVSNPLEQKVYTQHAVYQILYA